MPAKAVTQLVLCCLAAIGVFSPAYALTQEELVAKLQAAGYSQNPGNQIQRRRYGRQGR
jgi:hypothetical protein